MLDLERRRNISWMDEKTIKGMSSREFLESFAGSLDLVHTDIEFVLTRFGKLRDIGVVRGRQQTQLILAAAYLYLRWEGSGRQPRSPKSFIAACKKCGVKITRSALL